MVQVKIFQCNAFQENCYLVWDAQAFDACLIDPGFASEWEWQQVTRIVSQNHLTLKSVLLTHNHADHCLGSAFPVRDYGAEVYGSKADQDHLPSIGEQVRIFGLGAEPHWSPIVHDLLEGDVLTVGQSRIEVLDCPGHSHHGLCFYFPDDKKLFSGDVLFYCSVGRSDFGLAMGGNGPLLVNGIATKLLTLPPEVVVYPGHGPQTTIGTESAYNPYI